MYHETENVTQTLVDIGFIAQRLRNLERLWNINLKELQKQSIRSYNEPLSVKLKKHSILSAAEPKPSSSLFSSSSHTTEDATTAALTTASNEITTNDSEAIEKDKENYNKLDNLELFIIKLHDLINSNTKNNKNPNICTMNYNNSDLISQQNQLDNSAIAKTTEPITTDLTVAGETTATNPSVHTISGNLEAATTAASTEAIPINTALSPKHTITEIIITNDDGDESNYNNGTNEQGIDKDNIKNSNNDGDGDDADDEDNVETNDKRIPNLESNTNNSGNRSASDATGNSGNGGGSVNANKFNGGGGGGGSCCAHSLVDAIQLESQHQLMQICDKLKNVHEDDLKSLIVELKSKIDYTEKMNWLCK